MLRTLFNLTMMVAPLSLALLILPALCVNGEPVHMPLTRRSSRVRTAEDHFAAGDRARARYGFPTSKDLASKRMNRPRASTDGFAVINQVGPMLGEGACLLIEISGRRLELLFDHPNRHTVGVHSCSSLRHFPSFVMD